MRRGVHAEIREGKDLGEDRQAGRKYLGYKGMVNARGNRE
jgi:hypothetical protein